MMSCRGLISSIGFVADFSRPAPASSFLQLAVRTKFRRDQAGCTIRQSV